MSLCKEELLVGLRIGHFTYYDPGSNWFMPCYQLGTCGDSIHDWGCAFSFLRAYSSILRRVSPNLAFCICAGCWANPLFQDEDRSKWEEAVEVFWDSVTKVGDAANDATTQIKTSQLSKELE